MPPLRAEEEWVRQVMEAELGVPVEQHDDGSMPGMHDLDVVYGEGQRAAVEVTGAVDAEATEFWNTNVEGGWVELDLLGGWLVQANPNARRLRRHLPPFLRALEQAGVRGFDVRASGAIAQVAEPPQGVVKATQSETNVPGSIYLLPDLPNEQVAAFMADTGDPVAEWIGDFLRDDARADVRQKLARSGAVERHAFVIVSGFSGEQFGVVGLLMANDAELPIVAPDLPPEVTDVWVASVWASGFGFRWSSAERRWQKFAKPRLQRPDRA